MSLFMPIGFLLLVPFLLTGFRQYNKLVRFERENYPAEWERDGFPALMHWLHRDGDVMAAMWCAFGWLLSAPDWIRTHEETRNWLRRYRICVLVWDVGIIIVFALFVPRHPV